jgi:hypothetical protein
MSDLRPSGTWYFVTDVSEQPIRPIFKVKYSSCPETLGTIYKSTLPNISEEQRSRVGQGGSLQSHIRFNYVTIIYV